ncbi:MAG: type II secretion system F family protein [Akkermansia sp.]|nr:type II secretion system F family protein [Akkermansiaceae bacterium]MBQ3143913.1 type II secretion system F family protein [Akkermansia sp.]
MPNFRYTALDQNGAEKTGFITADNKIAAMEMVRSQGLLVRECVESTKAEAKAAEKKKATKKGGKGAKKEKKSGRAGAKVKQKEMMVFTRQLATLIDAGLPLLQSLNVLSKQEPNPDLRATIGALGESVQGGSTFSEALGAYPKMFNKLFVNMVKAGELGGVLEVVLKRLAEYQEKANRLRGKVVSAMVYPIIILVISVGILVFLMLAIVPKFKEMFEGQNMELPALSQFVFNFSDHCINDDIIPVVPNAFVFIVLLVAAGIGVSFWKKTPKGARVMDRFMLKIPKLGHLNKVSAVTRFSRTFGTLVASGVPILQALLITRDTAGNVIVADAITKIHDSVREGESIVTPMSACDVFPPMMISMVDVGEETGQLPDMLLKVAEVYDEEVDNAVSALTAMLEPLMIVFLAVVVGGIVLAMFMPMMEIIKNV